MRRHNDLYVPAATENPLDHRFLPSSRPTLQFPVMTHTQGRDRWHAAIILFVAICCSLAAASVPTSNMADHLRDLGLLGGVAFIISVVFLQDARYHPLLVALFFVAMAIILACALLPWLALCFPVVVAAFLLFEAKNFRAHYMAHATAGMYDSRTIDEFRRHFRLPSGLKRRSTFAGFLDALVSYVAYNRLDVRVPGVFLSPSGRYMWRLGKTFVLIFTLGITCGPTVAVVIVTLVPQLGPGLTSLALILLAAPFTWIATMFLATWSFAGKAYALKSRQLSPSNFQRLLTRFRNSTDTLERESILLGFVDRDRSPILYRLKSLLRHAWIVGKSGAGKTAYLMFLLSQIIDRHAMSVVFLDLKAISYEVLAEMQSSAIRVSNRLGRPVPVQHFSLDNGHSTYLFNVFTQSWWRQLPTAQRSGVVLSALSLAYSRAFGQSYFTDAAYHIVFFVLNRHADIRSWVQFRDRLQEAIRHARQWELSDEVKRDGEHIVYIVTRLAALSAINDHGRHPQSVLDNAIDFAQAFDSPRHYYFGLGAIKNGLVAGEVGRLVVAALLNAAAAQRHRKVPVLIVIDEFQEMVTQHLGILLTQARGLGVGVLLANQTTSQLITPDCDMRPTVEGNTAVQIWKQVTDEVGREQLQRLGGQHIVYLTSKSETVTQHGGSRTVSRTEQIVDRVTPNLVSAVGSDPRRFMLRLTDNDGYACYGDLLFAARSMFHQSKQAYAACCAMPWPAQSADTFLNDQAPPPPPTPPPAASTRSPSRPPSPPPSANRLGRGRTRTP